MQQITVNNLQYIRAKNEYIAEYKGRQILVDPFITDLMDHSNILEYMGAIEFSGEWQDDDEEDVFLPDKFRIIS